MWALQRRRRFSIVGRSMEPLLKPLHQVLVDPAPPLIKEDDIVVCKDPTSQKLLIKRVVIIEDGQYFVQGDNRIASTDSRHFGWLKRGDIQGLVVSILV